MLDDLLVYSRVSTRVKPLECVDLHKIIQDLRRLELAVQLEESNGVITIIEPLPPVQADPVQMHQLFQNLIGILKEDDFFIFCHRDAFSIPSPHGLKRNHPFRESLISYNGTPQSPVSGHPMLK